MKRILFIGYEVPHIYDQIMDEINNNLRNDSVTCPEIEYLYSLNPSVVRTMIDNDLAYAIRFTILPKDFLTNEMDYDRISLFSESCDKQTSDRDYILCTNPIDCYVRYEYKKNDIKDIAAKIYYKYIMDDLKRRLF